MSERRPRIETKEDRDRLHAARHDAGMCAACGRPLDPGEVVYHERFRLVPLLLETGKVLVAASVVRGPVGRECASPELLARTAGTEPERCVGCGRGVYYGAPRPGRRRALCSERCRWRATATRCREGVE
jgi:hypothetical protein